MSESGTFQFQHTVGRSQPVFRISLVLIGFAVSLMAVSFSLWAIWYTYRFSLGLDSLIRISNTIYYLNIASGLLVTAGVILLLLSVRNVLRGGAWAVLLIGGLLLIIDFIVMALSPLYSNSLLEVIDTTIAQRRMVIAVAVYDILMTTVGLVLFNLAFWFLSRSVFTGPVRILAIIGIILNTAAKAYLIVVDTYTLFQGPITITQTPTLQNFIYRFLFLSIGVDSLTVWLTLVSLVLIAAAFFLYRLPDRENPVGVNV